MSGMLNMKGADIVLCAIMVFVGVGSAGAGIIADFVSEPASPAVPELIWDGSELFEGPGAIGTGFGVVGPGDGEMPTAQQDMPGFLLETPFTVPGVPGSEINTMTGATTCYDVTLDIIATSGVNGMVFSGPAQVLGAIVVQPLGSGTLEIWSTDPVDAPDTENPVLLLAGVIDSAVITGILGSTTGATLSASVTYDRGAIIDAIGATQTGEFSWSLLDIDLPLAIDPNTNLLRGFHANAVGQFSGVPEPCTLGLLTLGGMALIRRKRK